MREQPKKRQAERMTRADSLESVQKYGRVIPPSQQPKTKPKRRGLVGKVVDALGGKK